jgi:LPPG:FO 2-phospho-L-lactate transferase
MSDEPCPTYVELDDARRLHFEEYLVRERSPDSVKHIDLGAAERAEPAPGVLEAIERADTIVLCPSNPVVSIGPILAVKGVRQALCRTAAPIVAVSPIIAGAAVKGPAEQLLRGTNNEVSARGVAQLYRDFLGGIVIDERDEELAPSIAAMGIRVAVTDTLMRDEEIATHVANEALSLAERLRENAP